MGDEEGIDITEGYFVECKGCKTGENNGGGENENHG